MASSGGGCCHPILTWLLHFLLLLVVIALCVVTFFTSLASRPRHLYAPTQRETELTDHETFMLVLIALSIFGAVCVNKAMAMISDGEYRDEEFDIEPEFKALAVMSLLTSIVNFIISVLLETKDDTILTFSDDVRTKGDRSYEFWFGSQPGTDKGTKLHEEKLQKLNIYTTVILVFNIVCLVACIVGIATAIGCNKREKYEVEKLMRSRSYRSLSPKHRTPHIEEGLS